MLKGGLQGKPLVVGASGQVGHQIALALGENNALLTSRGGKGPKCIRLDLARFAEDPSLAEAFLLESKVSAIFCAGGATDVDACEANLKLAMAVNCDGPACLAKAARMVPFVYFSTEYVFDGQSGPYQETDAPSPISVYGESKWRGEQKILGAHPSPLIIRTTVVYGSDPGEKNFLYALKRNLLAGKPLRVPMDQISTPTYNRDLAVAAIKLLHGGASGIFHVCGPELLSRYEFAKLSAVIMGLDSSAITGVPTAELNQRAPRPLRAGLLTQKLRTQFPAVSMRNAHEALQEWIRSA